MWVRVPHPVPGHGSSRRIVICDVDRASEMFSRLSSRNQTCMEKDNRCYAGKPSLLAEGATVQRPERTKPLQYSAFYAGLCLAARAARCKRVTKKHRWFESIIRHQGVRSYAHMATLPNHRLTNLRASYARSDFLWGMIDTSGECPSNQP